MRLLILLLGVVLLAPAPVRAQDPDASASASLEEEESRRPPRSCATLRKQIAHFEAVAERARERENELWEQSTENHLERLRARAERECPPEDGNEIFEALGRAARVAARTAVKLFTAGQL